MFDTMKITKAVAAVCTALLVFLFIKWGAETLYGTGHGGHGEGEHVADAYPIAAAEGEGGHGGNAAAENAAKEEGASITERLASADPAKGQKVFSKCKACHKLEPGVNATGPTLYGVVGRPIGSVEGFRYSKALAEHGGNWTPENLDAFLTKPKDFAPGTKMTFAGLKKPEDRANVIAYLQSIVQ